VGGGCRALGISAARAGVSVTLNASAASANYLFQLEARLKSFFSDQAQGFDIPPAVLYRLEGFIEAGVVSGFVTKIEMRDRLIAFAEHYTGADSAMVYRSDDRIILHVCMPEAPVYPSTKS
jgi:hypothetical protein